MKIYTRWFTLIELLIVVTIIAIVGVSSFSWFSRMLEVQDTETITKVLTNTLDGFDQAITRHEITSYETIFESGSLGFVTNLDWYKKPAPMNYFFDFVTGTGKVTSADTSTGTWELGFFTYDTPIQTYMLPANGGVQMFSFPENLQKRWYKILGAVGDSDLNSFEIQYYNLTNASQESEVRLTSISGSISEWNEKMYSSLIIRNVLGKKILQWSGTTMDTLQKAILFFDKNGKELRLDISL